MIIHIGIYMFCIDIQYVCVYILYIYMYSGAKVGLRLQNTEFILVLLFFNYYFPWKQLQIYFCLTLYILSFQSLYTLDFLSSLTILF